MKLNKGDLAYTSELNRWWKKPIASRIKVVNSQLSISNIIVRKVLEISILSDVSMHEKKIMIVIMPKLWARDNSITNANGDMPMATADESSFVIFSSWIERFISFS